MREMPFGSDRTQLDQSQLSNVLERSRERQGYMIQGSGSICETVAIKVTKGKGNLRAEVFVMLRALCGWHFRVIRGRLPSAELDKITGSLLRAEIGQPLF